MLTPDRIKPYLLHEDVHIRAAIAGYFGDCWSRDPDIVPMILDACDRYGLEKNRRGIVALQRFRLTEPAFEGVLSLLASAEERLMIDRLNDAILQAPVELFTANEPKLLANPNLDRETLSRLQRRRGFAARSPMKLWEEFQDFIRRAEDRLDADEIDLYHAEDLVAALSRHDLPETETICRLLRSPAAEGSWLEIFDTPR